MTNHIKIYGVKPRIQYVANGNLKKYEFPFAIFKTSDVDVYLDDKLLTISEYEVSVDPDIEGGAISFKVAPSNGTVITIARNLSIERTTDFQEGGALRANVLNDELDYQIACQQQIADSLNRSMVLPPYAVDTDVDLTLPTPSAGKAIVWNKDGTNLENSTIKVNELESTIKGYKTEAQNAATTATNKADIAMTQAQTATTQAGIATAKAEVASQKATEVSNALSVKANKDMDNLSSTGKITSAELALPDYSAGIGLTIENNSSINFTAPYPCFLVLCCCNGTNTTTAAIITKTSSGSVIVRNDQACTGAKFVCCTLYVPRGEQLTLGISGINQYSAYYPLKGAQSS